MVHHALATGQAGSSPHRFLYVDPLTFPKGGVPEVAAKVPAAAVAQVIVNYEDPSLPSDPRRAYLAVVRRDSGAFSSADDTAAVAAGHQACLVLAKNTGYGSLISTLGASTIDPLEAYTAMIAGAVYFCPAQKSLSSSGSTRPSGPDGTHRRIRAASLRRLRRQHCPHRHPDAHRSWRRRSFSRSFLARLAKFGQAIPMKSTSAPAACQLPVTKATTSDATSAESTRMVMRPKNVLILRGPAAGRP